MKQLTFNLQPSSDAPAHEPSSAADQSAGWELPRPHRGQGAPIRVVEVQSSSQAR